MATGTTEHHHVARDLKGWLLQGYAHEMAGPYEKEEHHETRPWWQVMCLTGLDYFSTLGYQPGIAALAAGALAPIATLVLVLLTLFGALPVYRHVAEESPHGQGSIAMLERLLSWWKGKFFVLALLGFAATDFMITMTLSAADATAHVVENPFTPALLHGHNILITLALLLVLGLIFLKGFAEAISIAVVLVFSYLALNLVVIAVCLWHVVQHPALVTAWHHALSVEHPNPLLLVVYAALVFPQLALGLSGFETGVAVMPLVRGDGADVHSLEGRIKNTKKLLRTAAVLMSFYLITSSFVTIVLIPSAAFQVGGLANGRALAFLAHQYLGSAFGTVYDVSTIFILWFAGASAMAGLLNLVPRYLPRYGMAPEWTRAVRPLVVIFIAIAFAITLIFDASVDKQGAAYATGVLVLMTSGAIAVTLSVADLRRRWLILAFGFIAAVFVYTTIANVFERPDGVKIAVFFIGTIVIMSLVSRVWRVRELRVTEIEVDPPAERFIADAAGLGTLRVIAHDPEHQWPGEYADKLQQECEHHNIPSADVFFLEVKVVDPSDFAGRLDVHGTTVGGHRIFRIQSSAVPNAIAAFLLYLRD
ncbi:MAG TPA: hypothetical protein VFI42_11035, partial [Thermomicrobiaceae bacterium]|nr:hypothetical protein [Thermomicrobiaceae bacterium]